MIYRFLAEIKFGDKVLLTKAVEVEASSLSIAWELLNAGKHVIQEAQSPDFGPEIAIEYQREEVNGHRSELTQKGD